MNSDEIAKILDDLGNRLGPAGQYVFELAVKQASIEGWFGLITSVIFLVLSTLLLIFTYKIRESTEYLSLVLGIIVFGTVVLGNVVMSQDYITKILNPEYAAISDLLSKIKP